MSLFEPRKIGVHPIILVFLDQKLLFQKFRNLGEEGTFLHLWIFRSCLVKGVRFFEMGIFVLRHGIFYERIKYVCLIGDLLEVAKVAFLEN